MEIQFNADEIFEVAEQIERNGAKFYRQVAEKTTDARVRQLLFDLAAMENEHEKTFTSMRADMSEQEREATVFDPHGEEVLYLRAMADRRVFDVKEDPTEYLTGKETMEDILRTAIGLEKDSIIFYLGLKPVVPPRLGLSRIDDIIKEEMSHIATLSKELGALQK